MLKKIILFLFSAFLLLAYINTNAIVCTTEYIPVCAKKDSIKKSYINNCMAQKDGAAFMYAGNCTTTTTTTDTTTMGCINDYLPVCGKKSKIRKSYTNLCFMIEDKADFSANGVCKLRDEKGCFVDTSKWCTTLKRCIKNTKYCPTKDYVPDISPDLKSAVDVFLPKFYPKFEAKYSSGEDRLKAIDEYSEKLDKAISSKYTYKAMLYYIIQQLEAKRVNYLSN